MQNSPLNHFCTILKRAKKQRLNYDAGIGAFTVGRTVTGTTSHATAVIDKVTTTYLVLKNLTGTFQNDEILTDPVVGSAVVNGICVDYVNSYGEAEYYWVTDQISVPCRFYYSSKNKARIIHETGQLIVQPLTLYLPSTVTITTGEYQISGISGSFAGTYEIQTVYPVSGRSGVDHYEAVLKKVP